MYVTTIKEIEYILRKHEYFIPSLNLLQGERCFNAYKDFQEDIL